MVSLQELVAKRIRLASAVQMMADAQREMEKARTEANFNSGMAMSWAAVLLAADILRDGLSAGNKEAAMGVSMLDKAVEQADKLLVAFGRAPMAKKSDALQTLDPNLRKINVWVDQVSQVRGWLSRVGIKEDKNLKLMLGIANDMAQDTLLMLQAGQEQTRLSNSNSAAISERASRLRRYRHSLGDWMHRFSSG